MTMDRLIREEARLIILKSLAEQPNETLNSSLLEMGLRAYGIARERAWVHGEMAYLREMGAITTTFAGSVVIGTLTQLGQRHLAREVVVEGVKRPSRPEA